MSENTAGPAEPIWDSRNSEEPPYRPAPVPVVGYGPLLAGIASILRAKGKPAAIRLEAWIDGERKSHEADG